MDAIVQIEDLYKRFGNLEVLKGVSLAVDRGEIFLTGFPACSISVIPSSCSTWAESQLNRRFSACCWLSRR